MVTFAKLKDGAWGLRGPRAEVVPGTTVTVTRKDGSTKLAVVGSIVWEDEEAALATISDVPAAGSSSAELERAANRLLRKAGWK